MSLCTFAFLCLLLAKIITRFPPEYQSQKIRLMNWNASEWIVLVHHSTFKSHSLPPGFLGPFSDMAQCGGARGIKLQEINGDWLIGSSTCNNAAGQQLIWCHPGHYRSDVCSASKGPSLQCRSSTVGWYWLNTGCTRRCTVAKTVGNWALPTLHSTVLQLPQSYHIVSDTIHISNIYISYLILESGRCQHCTLLLYHPPLSFCAQD